MVLNVRRSYKAYWGRGEERWWWHGGGVEEEDYLYLIIATKTPNRNTIRGKSM